MSKHAQVLRCFLNADMRNGHDGFRALAKKHGIDTAKLEPGEYLVFINGKKDKIKLYATGNIIAYLRHQGRINLETIREIPRAFLATGKIDYDTVLKDQMLKALERKERSGPLEVYRAMVDAGLKQKAQAPA